MNLFASMRVFVKIVDKGSLTAAAKALNLSSAMVGNHLQALEDHLGVMLLYRTTRRQNLTDFGLQYYHRCVDILERVTDAEQPALDDNKNPSGILRITAPISFGSEALIPLLNQFYRDYPDIIVDLVLGDRIFDLVEDDFDVAIRIGEIPDSGMIARRLGLYKMSVCASPEYIEQHGCPVTPEQLANHNCIQFKSLETVWKFEDNGKRIEVSVSGNLKVNNGQALKKAALEGLGIIMQPKLVIKGEIDSGNLVELFADYQLPAREMSIVYLRDRYMPAKIRCFIDFMTEHFSNKNDKSI